MLKERVIILKKKKIMEMTKMIKEEVRTRGYILEGGNEGAREIKGQEDRDEEEKEDETGRKRGRERRVEGVHDW